MNRMGFAKKALRCLLWLVAGAVGGVALLWLGASAYFLIVGRDIAPPDLSAYQLPHPNLQPDEDAYTYMKEYARGVKTNLNWNAAQAYIRGTANRKDCEEKSAEHSSSMSAYVSAWRNAIG